MSQRFADMAEDKPRNGIADRLPVRCAGVCHGATPSCVPQHDLEALGSRKCGGLRPVRAVASAEAAGSLRSLVPGEAVSSGGLDARSEAPHGSVPQHASTSIREKGAGQNLIQLGLRLTVLPRPNTLARSSPGCQPCDARGRRTLIRRNRAADGRERSPMIAPTNRVRSNTGLTWAAVVGSTLVARPIVFGQPVTRFCTENKSAATDDQYTGPTISLGDEFRDRGRVRVCNEEPGRRRLGRLTTYGGRVI